MAIITHNGTTFLDVSDADTTPLTGDTWEHEGINRVLLANGAWKETEVDVGSFIEAGDIPTEVTVDGVAGTVDFTLDGNVLTITTT